MPRARFIITGEMMVPPLNGAPEPPIESVLPHRAPMLLVEAVLERRSGLVVCRCRIGRDTPLAGDLGISSLVALELGAQASALLEPRPTGQAPGRSGYLVSIRRATLHRATLPLAVSLRVEARLLGRAGGLQLVRVRVASEDVPEEAFAEAELGTFLLDEPETEG